MTDDWKKNVEDPNSVHSLCHETARIGWVEWDEYFTDVEVSTYWNDGLRKFYYETVDTAIVYSRRSAFWRAIFLSPAFCYIKATNGVKEKNYKLLYWVPFVLAVVPTFLIATAVDQYERFFGGN